MILLLLAAAGSMLLQDVLGTVLVVAEARGRPLLAGAMDSAGDVARITTMGISLDVILKRGWCWQSVAVVAVIACTSFVATSLTTHFARRLQ